MVYGIPSVRIYVICSGILITAAFDVAFTLAGVQVLGITFEGNLLAHWIHSYTSSYPLSIVGGKIIGLFCVIVPMLLLLRRGYVLTFHTVAAMSIALQIVAGLSWIVWGMGRVFPVLIFLQTVIMMVAFVIDGLKKMRRSSFGFV